MNSFVQMCQPSAKEKKKLNEQYKFQTKYNTKGEILLNTIFQQQKNCVELELKES